MNELICPNCQKAFKVDETGFANMLKQVRDHQFEKELKKEKDSAVMMAETNLKHSLQEELAKKDAQLAQMESKIQNAETKKNLEVSEAIREIEKKHNELIGDFKIKENNKNKELLELKNQSDTKLAQMESKIQNAETKKNLEVSEAIKKIEKERDSLIGDLKIKEVEKESLEVSIKEKFTDKLAMKDEEIDRLKDFKQKLSTKMVGETLEQHCEIEFNTLRATAFQKCLF